MSRLIFLCFLETKGWLNGDFSFLANGYSQCLEAGGRYQRRVLEPLFFGTLNTMVSARSPRAREFGRIPFLNGGLFRALSSKSSGEPAFSPTKASATLTRPFFPTTGLALGRPAPIGRKTSIDPEILGKAFEALMGSVARKQAAR